MVGLIDPEPISRLLPGQRTPSFTPVQDEHGHHRVRAVVRGVWYERSVTLRLTNKGGRRAAWPLRAIALLLAVILLVSSTVVDDACFLALDAAGQQPADDDDGAPCPCPLDCASCVVVRAVPTTAPSVELVPVAFLLEGAVPPIAAEHRPTSPEPGEILHVPKA